MKEERTTFASRVGQLAQVDARSLAAFRICIALILLYDLYARWPHIELIYTNTGIFPDHFALFSDATPRLSALLGLSSVPVVQGFFLVSANAYLALLVGWRTQAALLLSLLCSMSIHMRAPMAMYGGDVVVHSFLVWALFLPLGRRWSVDVRFRTSTDPDTIRSVAVLGFTAQLSAIYFFNGLNKTGVTWSELSAVHHAIWQDSVTKPLGLWLRGSPVWFFKTAAVGTLVVEYGTALALWCPFLMGRVRLVALTFAASLHLGIWLVMDVGAFSPTMWITYLLFISPAGWDKLAQFADDRRWTLLGAAWSGTADSATPPPDSAEGEGVRSAELRLREGLASFACVSMFVCMAGRNGGIPERMRPKVPTWAAAPWDFLGVSQGWGLFAPDAPPDDGWFVIDALRSDGTHVDPLTLQAPISEVPVGYAVGQSHVPFAWTRQMRHGPYAIHRPSFDAFVWRSHLRDGADASAPVVQYTAYNLVRRDPPLGSDQPGPWEAKALYTSVAPGSPP